MKVLVFSLLTQALAAAPLPGVEAVLDRTDLRYIVVGESHGTAQMPAAFGDLATAAARRGPTVVALEHSGADHPLLDAYLASKGDRADRAALLKGVGWTQKLQDGRTSVAMLDLLERLRQLRHQGANLTVVACQPFKPEQIVDYEKSMGLCWRDAGAAHPEARVLVLVGNIHADRAPAGGRTSAIAALPAAETLSLIAGSAGGQAWSCKGADCGPIALYRVDDLVRGVHLTPRDGHYDGVLAPGGVFTASPPAAP